jgi:hypothetical protein
MKNLRCCPGLWVFLMIGSIALAYTLYSEATAQEGPDWNKGLPRQHN